VLLGTVPDGLG